MEPWYIAATPFGPADGAKWDDYVRWSGLSQLRELVSLDPMLCRPILGVVKDLYWDHIVQEDFMLDYFRDLPFMLRELGEHADGGRRHVLCVVRNPSAEPVAEPAEAGFALLGYDLVDVMGSASALSNCGGFPDVFANGELNACGLLDGRERAFAVRDQLKARHPREPHADCHVWAIFRSDRLSRA